MFKSICVYSNQANGKKHCIRKPFDAKLFASPLNRSAITFLFFKQREHEAALEHKTYFFKDRQHKSICKFSC